MGKLSIDSPTPVFLPPSRDESFAKDQFPKLLYLPGLDGTGLSAVAQYEDLESQFEFHRLCIAPVSRVSFEDLVEQVLEYVKDLTSDGGHLTIVGESFGGLLATAVCCEDNFPKNVNLVLVNPATSFQSTSWKTLAPALTNTAGKTPLYPYICGGVLAVTVPSLYQSKKLTTDILMDLASDPLSLPSKSTSLLEDFTASIIERLPPKVVEFRVKEWCDVGSKQITAGKIARSLSSIPTLVIVGDDDKLLPSKDEGRRLKDLVGPNCTLVNYPKGSHFILDDQVNLTDTILTSPLFRTTDPDPIKDFKLPPPATVERIIDEQVKPFRRLASPKFFSTSPLNDVTANLNHVPINELYSEGKPLLIVGNHQFGGLDLGLVMAELLEVKGRVPRGLAHPVIFQGGGFGSNSNTIRGDPGGGGMGGQMSYFKTFGAVEVGPRSFYRLMEAGQPTLLFPGGVREVFHGRGEQYKLFWPSVSDFVRTAAKFNATVVTLAGVGAYDSSTIVADQKQLLDSPLGGRLRENSFKVPNARGKDGEEEVFVPPISIPKFPPARHYFLFGKPVDLSGLDHKDKLGCEKIYQIVKSDLEVNLDRVLRARKGDKYNKAGKEGRKRLAYEALFGEGSAPTFSAKDL